MASITSAGLGSGLDVNTLVSQLMVVERQPLQALSQKAAVQTAKISAYGTMKGALSALQTAAQALTKTDLYSTQKAKSGDATILSATGSTTASAGNYSVEVTTMAKSDRIVAEPGIASTSSAFQTGTLTIELGSYDLSNVFTADTSKSTLSLTIDSRNNTLAGIRDAINAKKGGVTASIINDGTNNRLVISSEATGAKSAMRVVGTNTGGSGNDLSALSFDRGGASASNFTEPVKASDASIKIDSVPVTSSSNTITDAIQGVTLTLVKEASSTSVAVTRDTSAANTAVTNFVKAYNDVVTQIKNSTAYDAKTKQASVLTGDATARSISQQLRGIVTGAVSGADANMNSLSAAGIRMQLDGTLKIEDSTKLSNLLNDTTAAQALFGTSSGTTGIARQLDTSLTAMLATSGTLGAKTEGLERTVKDITKRAENLTLRLEQVEKRYRAQFSALDTTISSMSQTSTFLTQQIAKLNANTSS